MDILDKPFSGLVLVTETRQNIDVLQAGLDAAKRMMKAGVAWTEIKPNLPVIIMKDIVPFNEAIKDGEIYILDRQAKRLAIVEILSYNAFTMIIYINEMKVIPLDDKKFIKLISKYLPTTFAS